MGSILFPHKQVWAPLEVQGLVWKVAWRRELTANRLQIINLHRSLSPKVCVMCYRGPETNDHLLVHCPLVATLWKRILYMVHLHWVSPETIVHFIFQWKANHLSGIIRPLWNLCLHRLMWTIWLERDRRVLGFWAKTRGEFRSYSLVSFDNLSSILSSQENGTWCAHLLFNG